MEGASPVFRGVQKGVQPLDCIKMVVTMNKETSILIQADTSVAA